MIIEYITTKKVSYSFICHKKAIEGTNAYFPINALALNPKYGSLATGGSDATVSIWDVENQKKISCLSMTTSISSMCFSEDGNKLAMASSYNGDKGMHDSDNNHKVIIRNSTETELKLK